MPDIISYFKLVQAVVFSAVVNSIVPIHNFFIVIMIFATLNILFGFWADNANWSFKKAYRSITYLIGYMFVIFISALTGSLMGADMGITSDFVSWVTYVMIYFYARNILRNWHIKQQENKIVSFLYWAVSFKIVENVKWIKDYQEEQLKEEKNDKFEF